MKKKGTIILSLLLIGSLILAGCSGGPSATETATSEANDSLQSLNEGILDGDEAVITNYISDDGVTVVDNTNNNTEEYTKEDFITDLSGSPQSFLMLNLISQTSQVNGDTVTISGEPSASFQLPSGNQISQPTPANLTTDNSTDPITILDTYNGTNYSVEYPDSWYSTSFSETASEFLMAIPDGQQKKSLAMWQEDVFTSNTLSNLMDELNTIFLNMESRTELPNIDNANFDYSDNSNYADAKDYTVTYDYNYKPLTVEIKLQKEGDTYKITQITIGQSSSVKTVPVTENGIVINKNDDMYFISYSGNDDLYNETEANNIFNSFEI